MQVYVISSIFTIAPQSWNQVGPQSVTITMIIGMMLMMMMAMTVMMMKKKMMMSAVMVPRIEVLKTRSRTVISVSTILELLVAVKMLPLPVL